jgi:hypothetical protein
MDRNPHPFSKLSEYTRLEYSLIWAYTYEKGWITNKGITNSLLAKIANVQKHQSDEKQLIKGLNPLQNEGEGQSGKHITHEFAE